MTQREPKPGADLAQKQRRLESLIQSQKSLLVAFSGGVDSTFLLKTAHDLLGQNVLAVTAVSALQPRREYRDALNAIDMIGARHQVIETHELDLAEFAANPADRCYICKKNLFRRLRQIAEACRIQAVAHGANADDENDYRPGAKAAREMGIMAPLLDAGLTKAEIRILSHDLQLPTWNKPAMACLATRIPYGEPLSQDRLRQIEAAEEAVLAMGFSTCRVRHHGTVARIEVLPEEISRLNGSLRQSLSRAIKALGFDFVALELEGYTSGSLNRSLP